MGTGDCRRKRLRKAISGGGPDRLIKYVFAEYSSRLIQVYLVAGQLSVVGCHSHKQYVFYVKQRIVREEMRCFMVQGLISTTG